jgi:hypothetical protein
MILAPNRRIHKLAKVPADIEEIEQWASATNTIAARPAPWRAGSRITAWCRSAPPKGLPAQLSTEQLNIVKHVYDNHEADLLIRDPVLAAYLALTHICGIQARGRFRPKLNVDAGVVWAAAGPSILAVLKRDDAGVICSGLDTRYPIAV